MLGTLTDAAIRRPRETLGAAAAVAVLLCFVGLTTPNHLGLGGFADSGSESGRVERELQRALHAEPTPELLIATRGRTLVTSGVYRVALATIASRVRGDPAVGRVRRGPISAGGRVTVLEVYFRDVSTSARAAAVRRIEADIDPGPLEVLFGGAVPTMITARGEAKRDVGRLVPLAVPIVLLLLIALVGLRITGAAAVVGAVGMMGSVALMRVVDAISEVSVLGVAAAAVVAIAIAVEAAAAYAERYREEAWLLGPGDSAARDAGREGGAVVGLAAGAVALVSLALLAVPLGFVRSLALGAGSAALIAAIAALVVMPAVLALGAGIEPRRVESHAKGRPSHAYRLAELVTWRRLTSLATAVLVLAACLVVGALGLRAKTVAFGAGGLPAQSEPRTTQELLSTAIGPGVGSPVLIQAETGSGTKLAAYAKRLKGIRGVKVVSPPRELRSGRGPLQKVGIPPIGAEQLIQVRLEFDPGGLEAQQAVRQIRSTDGGFPTEVGGATAELIDADAALDERLPIAAAIAFLLVAALLGTITRLPLRSPLAALTAAPAVVAAAGILVLVFQDGRLEQRLDYTSRGALELGALVTCLVTLAMVCAARAALLVAVTWRERETYPDASDAAARSAALTWVGALASTVTLGLACGVLARSDLLFMKEFAVGAVAVLVVDMIAVRLLLGPGFMRLGR